MRKTLRRSPAGRAERRLSFMVEWTDLPEGVLEDMKRYISYAWPPGRIAQLLNRSYGLDLTREAVIHMLRRLKQESV
jgi:hypothetical protein